MTTISATIIADSQSSQGKRLTTLQLRYPRCIHSEFMTHRVFSRNASSSRAIPVKKLIQDIIDDPFVPLHWGKNESGMQANQETDAPIKFRNDSVPREAAWLRSRDFAVQAAQRFADAGYHKQIVNRLLEPYTHINTVVTSTDWINFIGLRDHKDAEPHIAILAREVKKALFASIPKTLAVGDWHLPYVEVADYIMIGGEYEHGPGRYEKCLLDAIKLSAARCASVSFKTVDGLDMTLERARAVYDKLVTSQPIHASPCEHQGTPDKVSPNGYGWHQPAQHGNFDGWIQFRKTLPNENITELWA